ncbi:MAG: hypothetical protein R3D25_19740 [Geminicoccaceae bacterium]
MCTCDGGSGYELLQDRLAGLERELGEALSERDTRRAALLRRRIRELRCGCRRLLASAA